MPTPTRRRARIRAGLVAGALTLLPLAACDLSSDNVSCSGKTCTVTLSGNGAKATVLGNTLAFAGTSGGQASVTVGDHTVSCTQGQSVDAGPLTLSCSKVTDTSVELSASLG